MPKIYSDNEREILEQKIMSSATKLFAKQGFQKTSISQITKTVGIAAGTFYNFFSSKEALFFHLMGEAEQQRFAKIAVLFTKEGDPKEEFTSFLKETFLEFIENPVYKCLYNEDLFERIVKKIPEETLYKHVKYDMDAAKAILESTHARGYLVTLTPVELMSQLRALFIQTIHQEEIGVENMTPFMLNQIDIYVEGVSNIYAEDK